MRGNVVTEVGHCSLQPAAAVGLENQDLIRLAAPTEFDGGLIVMARCGLDAGW